ncbi:hypothetical protein ACUXK4_004531 [Methylorubrum extorquens]
MPTPPAAFRHLARLVTRHPHGAVECALVIKGVRVELDASGLPLQGVYFEQDVEDIVEDTRVIVSRPVISLAVADLPGIPQRGDQVIFDDGPYTVLYPVQRGAGVDLFLQPGAPGRPRR